MKLYMNIKCQATYKGCFEVPDGMPPEEAMRFAQEHIEEIPRQYLTYVPGTAKIQDLQAETARPAIRTFRGDYAFLSNFYECPVVYDRLEFRNAEAAFQAAKCEDANERQKFIGLNAVQAKRLGRRVRLRPGWDNIKLRVMIDIVEAKFRNPDLREKLLATGDAELIEGNDWGDRYWGVTENGNGKGKNYLGKILMSVRQSCGGAL